MDRPAKSSDATGLATWIHRQCARWFAGLTWKGMALVLLVCVLNAARRRFKYWWIAKVPFLDSVAEFARVTGEMLIIAVIVALAVVATCNLVPARPSRRYPAVALAVALSSLVGVVAWLAVSTGGAFDLEREGVTSPLAVVAEGILGGWLLYGMQCAIFAVVYLFLREADESVERALQAERDRALFVQRMDEARLRMLQAQIEPHFLFNTLATVRRLYETSPGDAATMLDNLMRYLAVALPQMRASGSTLGREADLTGAYLDIQRIRMGSRLAYDIAIPESLRNERVPPMMLLTLAENAIKHGLAPLPEGGQVRVSATVSGDELQMRVEDTGRGFVQSSGGGTGLANIRARLTAVYGPAGRLTLAHNTPRGIAATIAVPLSSTVVLP
jgi:signal transduction histidine kinase